MTTISLSRSAVLAGVLACAFAVPGSAQARWRLVPDRTFTSAEMTEVADVCVGGDGTTYVVHPQDGMVRTFSPSGAEGPSLGRKGGGPGEFSSPQQCGWRGDTLVVSDLRGRLNAYAGGRPVATLSLPAAERFRPLALLANGRVVGRASQPANDVVVGRVTRDTLRSVARDGSAPRTLAALARRHGVASLSLGTRTHPVEIFFPQPFGHDDLVDPDPAGRWVTVVSRPAGEGARARFRVTRVRPDGARAWAVEAPVRSAALPRGAVDDTIDAYAAAVGRVGGADGPPPAAVRDALARAIFAPAWLPPVRTVVAGRDGTTWLRRWDTAAEATWWVLDDRGRTLASVQAPAGMTLHAADLRHAWGVVLDADDVPSVVRYRVEPVPAR